MPLPPALAAKLAKRGLLQQKNRVTTGNKTLVSTPSFPTGYVEEIIAESYDDDDEPTTAVPANKISKFQRVGHFGCPNKYNIYHICSQFCVSRWGRGRLTAEYRYNTRRLRMLKKYPLPAGWREVYDPGCARYYYWNIETDSVCWVCPSHPKAVVTRPASELRAQIIETGVDPFASTKPSNRDHRDDRRRHREERSNNRRQGRVDELDPMDPAAYSDIPRGDWNAGLEKPGDGKTGADTTASGPLFQSRPYPNPGAILRANASDTKSRKPKSKSK